MTEKKYNSFYNRASLWFRAYFLGEGNLPFVLSQHKDPRIGDDPIVISHYRRGRAIGLLGVAFVFAATLIMERAFLASIPLTLLGCWLLFLSYKSNIAFQKYLDEKNDPPT